MPAQISIRTSPILIEQFNAVAKATGRTRSYLIKQAMEEYIAREAWQTTEIMEALREADKGQFLSDTDMQTFWAKWTK